MIQFQSLMFPGGTDVRRVAEDHIKRKELLHKTCKAGPEENFFEDAREAVTVSHDDITPCFKFLCKFIS